MTSVALRHTERGDAEEAGRLFAEHSERIFGYCLRRLGSRSEAEDAVQTTFVYTLRALRRGVVPECEIAWLTTIARNVCHWQRRTLDRRGPLASDVDLDTIGLAHPGHDEDDLLVGLKEALASIPENQRRALVLREWQGVPPREIAKELGMSATATYALLTRARHSLAHALTALPQRRSALGLNFGTLLFKLKALLVGGTANAAATTVIAAGIAVGGVVAVERVILVDRARPPAPSTGLYTYVDGIAPASTTGLYAYVGETARGPRTGWSSPGPTLASPIAIASNPSPRADAAAASWPSGSATTTVGIGASKEIPGSVSDPRLAGSAGSDESLGESGLPDPFPEPIPLPESILEPPPVPELKPPAELPGDVPQSPPPLPESILEPPPVPELESPGKLVRDVPQSPPVDSELSLDELLPASPAPAGLPEMEVPGRP